jgi:hypothetical protein
LCNDAGPSIYRQSRSIADIAVAAQTQVAAESEDEEMIDLTTLARRLVLTVRTLVRNLGTRPTPPSRRSMNG